MPLLGVIANQCHRATSHALKIEQYASEISLRTSSADLASDTVNRMMARMRSAHNRLLMLQSMSKDLVRPLKKVYTTSQGLHQVPKIKGEVHDLPALFKVGQFLMEDS